MSLPIVGPTENLIIAEGLVSRLINDAANNSKVHPLIRIFHFPGNYLANEKNLQFLKRSFAQLRQTFQRINPGKKLETSARYPQKLGRKVAGPSECSQKMTNYSHVRSANEFAEPEQRFTERFVRLVLTVSRSLEQKKRRPEEGEESRRNFFRLIRARGKTMSARGQDREERIGRVTGTHATPWLTNARVSPANTPVRDAADGDDARRRALNAAGSRECESRLCTRAS